MALEILDPIKVYPIVPPTQNNPIMPAILLTFPPFMVTQVWLPVEYLTAFIRQNPQSLDGELVLVFYMVGGDRLRQTPLRHACVQSGENQAPWWIFGPL